MGPCDEAASIFWAMQTFRCFHTRASFHEDETILGIGIAMTSQSQGTRKVLTCDFDPISFEAFRDLGVRHGVWKQPFSHWLPLAICKTHFNRSRIRICESLIGLGTGDVAEATRSHGRQTHTVSKAPPLTTCSLECLDPEIILNVLPKLMNSQVVLLMEGNVHASEKALAGYMAFHHLFLMLKRCCGALHKAVEAKVGAFVKDEKYRTKEVVPNLGEFICLLSVSDQHSWKDMAEAVLNEGFDRHMLWTFKKYPELAYMADLSSSADLTKLVLKASEVSRRLYMFQVWFLHNVAQVPHAHPHRVCRKARCLISRYERTRGIPGQSTVTALQKTCRNFFCSSQTWNDFFNAVDCCPMEDREVKVWLIGCARNSERKGYHKRRISYAERRW